jgi:flagellar biosynthetic protein FliQ
MPDDVLIQLLKDMMWISMLLMLPPLLAALIVGLVVGLIQAVTSIQEQTLAFIPKLLAIALVLTFAGPWMLRSIVKYTTDLFVALPQWGAL